MLPLAAEKLPPGPGYSRDPLAEAAAAAIPGLLHKYRGRALLVVTGACAVHCRYCFRRHFPYAEQRPDWGQALDYLAADPSIEEILHQRGRSAGAGRRKTGRSRREFGPDSASSAIEGTQPGANRATFKSQ